MQTDPPMSTTGALAEIINGNTTDNSSASVITEKESNFWESGLIVIFCVTGLTAYGHLFYSIVSPNKLKKYPVYICIFSLGVANCVYLLIFICYNIPCRIHGSALAFKPLDTVISAVGETCWMVTLTSLVFQSLYRYVKISECPKLKHLIKDKWVKFYVVGCFTAGFFTSLPSYFPCCAIDGFTFTFIPQAVVMSTFDLSYSCVCFSLCILLNTYTTVDILKKRKVGKSFHLNQISSTKMMEIRLFYQLSCVVIFGIVATFAFNIIPRFCEDTWVFYLLDFLNILFITIDAWVYIILNETVHEEIRTLYRCKQAEVGIKTPNSVLSAKAVNPS